MKREIFRMIHKKCRNGLYPSSNIQRYPVPDEKVSWMVDFPEYSPVHYTSKVLENKPYADLALEEISFKPRWNELDNDGKINRVSFMGKYLIDDKNYPLNPLGRTGIRGRGILGRWGPNHAADPIVTRWKKDQENTVMIDEISRKPILQFIGIQRRDSGEWALPGGMVDPGEKVSITLKREFMEEAMNSLEKDSYDLKNIQTSIDEFFKCGEEIYKGYVDDPRNTDNSWMETEAFNFHDDSGNIVGKMNLQAGDDAKNVKWLDIDDHIVLYASHKEFIMKVANKFNAHW